jgi:hypothetical protein
MALGREDEYLTTGLWAATQKHIKERRVKPTYLKQVLVTSPLLLCPEFRSSTMSDPRLQQFTEPDGSWDRSYYYTNFEIVYMPFFRGHQYQSFFQDLDSTQGFYDHRWGDAPIRLLGLAMYAQPAQVQLLDLPYSHKVASQQCRLRLRMIAYRMFRCMSTWPPCPPHPIHPFEHINLQILVFSSNFNPTDD